MNLPDPCPELDHLFAQARAVRVDTSRLEYGFEARLLARLRKQPIVDWSALLSQISWRLIPALSVGVFALAFWVQQISAENENIQIDMAYDDTPATVTDVLASN